jgi:hypothetical protein
MSLIHCQPIELPQIPDARGNLTVIEGDKIPFQIRRVYYLSDVPDGTKRGGHAHKALHQFIFASSGAFDIHLDDGHEKRTVHLHRNNLGLYVCPMIWREIDNFSPGAVCMVLASDHYLESDYYRDYSDFLATVRSDLK